MRTIEERATVRNWRVEASLKSVSPSWHYTEAMIFHMAYDQACRALAVMTKDWDEPLKWRIVPDDSSQT